MRVLKTILWLLLAVVVVLFATANWVPVEVRIGLGLVLETKLPVLVIAAFLLGWLPTWTIYRLAMWRLARRPAEPGEGAAVPASGADDAAARSPAPVS